VVVAGAVYLTDVQADTETPAVTPGEVVRFHTQDLDKNDYVLPMRDLTITTRPVARGDSLTEWVISITNTTTQSGLCSVAVVFSFTARLSRLAANSIHAIGGFSYTFASPVNTVSVTGYLMFEQNEIEDFRGSFERATATTRRCPTSCRRTTTTARSSTWPGGTGDAVRGRRPFRGDAARPLLRGRGGAYRAARFEHPEGGHALHLDPSVNGARPGLAPRRRVPERMRERLGRLAVRTVSLVFSQSPAGRS